MPDKQTKTRPGRRLILAAFVLFTTGCGDDEATPGKAPEPATQAPKADTAPIPPRVAESFGVGEQVYVRSLALDKANKSLWVGTTSGVLEIDIETSNLRNTFTREHGLANEYIFAIFIDSQGDKWFGTNAGGVSRYRDGEWKVLFPMHGLADYWIYSFAEQKNGPMWIGTWAGVNSVDLATLDFKTYVKELVNEWVYAIDIDSKDRVWFGTEGGISLFDGETWRHWTHDDGMGAPNPSQQPASTNTGLGTRSRHSLSVLREGRETYNPNYVFSLVVDDQDHVWAGTWGGGVARYDGEKWTNLTTADGLAGNIVYSIAREDSGVFWFGTSRGLSRYDGENWTRYDQSNGLLDSNVYAVAIGTGGDVWAGTKRGVTRISNQIKVSKR